MQNNLKTNVIGAIAILALIFGFISLVKGPSTSFGTVNNGGTASNASAIIIPANTTLPDGYQTPNPSVFDYLLSRGLLMAQNVFGMGNGTAVPTYQQVNRMILTAATTTPCALQNPFSATSTIPDGVTFNITTSTSTAGTLTFATSTSAYATTSTFSTQTAGANLDGTYTANGSGPVVVAGNGWIVVGVAGAPYPFTYGGSCQATFQTAN